MRIGINALYLIPGGVGGTEIYLRELLRWLPEVGPEHEYHLLVNRESEEEDIGREQRMNIVRTGVPAQQRPSRLLYEQVLVPSLARQLKLDVLFNPGFTAPALSPCPNVTTFHDLQHKRHPEYFRWFDLPAWNFFMGLSARRSRRIIAISEATAGDFRRYYPRCRQPIDVTPLGAREDYAALASRRRDEKDFLLCVSTLHPHKNHVRLVRAFTRWREESGANTELVLAGMRGFAAKEVEAAITECGAARYIRITGWISDDELKRLFAEARALVFPSLFEGFGIPVVEAMACGLPVAVSDVEPMRSIAGDAALRFSPREEDAIVRAIDTLLRDEGCRQRLRAAGIERAKHFTWKRTAELTLTSLEQAAESRTR